MNYSPPVKLTRRRLDATTKALPLAAGQEIDSHDVPSKGWNIVAGDLDLPVMVLKEAALSSNIQVMASYCRRNGVDLAPHGKTSMSPQLFERQLAAGAWAMTAATPWHCRAYRAMGVQRLLLANVMIEKSALTWVSGELDSDPAFDFYCYVDSVRGVELAEAAFREAGGSRPLGVLIELGYAGGRTGCRNIDDALHLAAKVVEADHLVLRGIAGYEGLMPGPDVGVTMARSRAFLRNMRSLLQAIDRAGLFQATGEVIVTAGGSAYFDLVVSELGPQMFGRPVRTVLRSGCYVTHDVGMYGPTSPLAGRSPNPTSPQLRPAFELWATVWSRPEAGLAIVGFGKRDAPYDYGPPVPEVVWASGATEPRSVAGLYRVTALNDQHAFVSVPDDDDLQVGDRLVCGISHPCGAFDKWKYIPVVDANYTVVDGIFTYF
ncbi:MAG: amino acid deaminase [Actinomycetota bacterium]|nr:amino acid deaminase [Actinomycetota bacterium]